ncbi:MAG TPA: response regulator [Candidatus Polarisedimenticolia bacterium]|nr:response regulator [Candidatus Polarisedimenticolia bacterium]
MHADRVRFKQVLYNLLSNAVEFTPKDGPNRHRCVEKGNEVCISVTATGIGNRELLRELLELRGYTVVEACNGEETLRMIEQTQPDLLLLDIGMPVLDGFAGVRKIRENPLRASLPVVAVTAYAMQGDREKILNANFDGYLSKLVKS